MPLVIASLITVVVCVVFSYLDIFTKSGNIKPVLKQTITGVVFGLCAIYATEIGSFDVNGAALNCRDAAPILSGLVFGPWSGVLTGLIGGIERYCASFHGIGTYTQLACSLACIGAGGLAGLVKATIFRKNPPTFLHGIVVTILCEALHMALVPLTHWDDLPQATVVMVSCFGPLVFSNTIAVIIGLVSHTLMVEYKRGHSPREVFTKGALFYSRDLSFSFQFWILLIVVVTFTANILISAVIYEQMTFATIAQDDISELNNISAMIEVQKETGEGSLVETAVEVANKWIDEALSKGTENCRYLMIVDPYGEVLSKDTTYSDNSIVQELVDKKANPEELYRIDTIDTETGKSVTVLAMYQDLKGYKMIIFTLEKFELYLPHLSMAFTTFFQILVFGLLMLCVFFLLRTLVSNNLNKVNKSLDRITDGHLDERVEVNKYTEFIQLSGSINQTVDKLNGYIEKEANRFKKDFELAHQIQMSALPSVFPAFPERTEIDIYATYQPAREIGGDFYDFYFLDNEHFAFLIADVSGKGIPAAMFMMRAKTAIRAYASQEHVTGDVMSVVNNHLCDNNEAEMFVTCWFGVLNTTTGLLEFSSAGHNPPILIRPDNTTTYLENKPGLVLGGMKDLPYKSSTTTLLPGDKLFLYTDGITEANNEDLELYGEERLLHHIESCSKKNCIDLCVAAKSALDAFVGDAEQFDDETMLAVQYNGLNKTDDGNLHEFEITVEAKLDNQQKITDILEETFEYIGAPMKLTMQVNVAIDEIYSNICNYGYKDEEKLITVQGYVDHGINPATGEDSRYVKLVFIDTAERFNPIDVAAPDTTLSAEEREIGGLGIFMVRNIMDEVFYEYKGGSNRLSLIKYFEVDK